MMTISYEYGDSLYVNLTNKCDCACVFCLRHNGHKGSIYASDLWLEREPTRQEALDDLLSRDYSKYRQLGFCGFGEPTFRLDDILWLVDRLKEQVPNLPPVRINTNGHANRPGCDTGLERPYRRAVHLSKRLYTGRICGRHPSTGGRCRLGRHVRFYPPGRAGGANGSDDRCGQGQDTG